MNINKSNLVVYPSAGSSERGYKLNSEKNLSGISNKLVRNKVIEGLEVSSNVVSGIPNLIITPGIASINGYGVRITNNIEFSDISALVSTADSYYLVILKLSRASNGNLQGMDLDGNNYLGLEVDIISDGSSNYSDEGTLIVGTVILSNSIYTAESYKKSRSTLRAQDIFVEGATDSGDNVESDQQVTSGSNGNYTADYLNPSATLDEFLANMVISDGQFN